ncbi:MAG: pre-peptidase C-terminal domain-containing protein, partial [Bacteroidia bacterium]|nr:pre-peptidase C-terminal domain-containing protein [Bacteroidia bacterium]
MKKILTTLSIIVSAQLSFSQGDTPCAAVSLTPNASCTYTAGTTVGASYQSNAANGGTPSCASPGAPDVWYSFVAPAGGTVTITTQAGTITDGGMSLYSATTCSTGLTQLACNDDAVGLMPQINQSGLTAGATYYIRVWKYSSGTGTFGICITLPAAPPANDNCTGATLLVSNTSC